MATLTVPSTPTTPGTRTVRRDDISTPNTEKVVSRTVSHVSEVEEEVSSIEITFTPVDSLCNFGINTSDIKKLRENGVNTVERGLMLSKRKLAAMKGFSDAKADKIYDAGIKINPSIMQFHTAKDVLTRREENVVKVTTGSSDLDAILDGGIESGSITEVYGEFRTGKSQMALTIAVASYLPREVGGGEGRAVFLDTEGSFRPERLAPIAARFELDADYILSSILHARIHNCDHLDQMLIEAAAIFADAEDGPFRVLIVDSIIGNYRQEFIGRGELAERQQRIGQVVQNLKRMAEEFNVAVFYTNQVTADPGGAALVADAKKPVGGNIVAHGSDTRVYLRKGRGDQRVARIVDSPLVGEGEATYQITAGGITNPID